ncbi:MAG: glycosyltransferase family 4 protein [Planctomycetota bacterium]|jgi:glycosyltransferase involved in cell wall biosynthesis
MKILFLTENFPPEMNAAATRVFERACYWIDGGHEVTIITCAPNFPQGKVHDGYKNRWYQVETMNGMRVVRVKTYISANAGTGKRILDFLSFMIMGTLASLFEKKFDVVAATSPQFFSAVAGWMVGLLRRRPFVFELGDLWPASITAVGAMNENLFLRWMEKLELFLYRQSECVAALTQSFKKDLIRRDIPAEKIGVVINGVDLSRYQPAPRDTELAETWGVGDRFCISYIGTHGMAHALENVVEAADLLKDIPEICFLFVGPGAAREGMIELAKAKGLTNMIFVPAQPKETMPRFWSLSDVALVHLKDTPVFESVIPSKIFEAMGMGLPILLASPEGEASEIVLHEKAGLHVIPEDPALLAEAVRCLYTQPEQRRTLAEASHNAAPRYSRERQAKDMMTVLTCAAERRGMETARALGECE